MDLKLIFALVMSRHSNRNLRLLIDADKAALSKIATVVLHIQEQYWDRDLSIKTASAKFGISADHLGRQFKAFTGQTFHSYLRNCRINQAAKLLINTARDVKDIAFTVGYSDRNGGRFSQHFRELKGCSPLEFRNKYRQCNTDHHLLSSASRTSPVMSDFEY